MECRWMWTVEEKLVFGKGGCLCVTLSRKAVRGSDERTYDIEHVVMVWLPAAQVDNTTHNSDQETVGFQFRIPGRLSA